MAIVASPLIYNNVRQGRSCGAFTTNVLHTPRPASARATPRMGGHPLLDLTLEARSYEFSSKTPAVEPRRSARASRRGSSATAAPGSARSGQATCQAKYRESWTDTTDARDAIAAEGGPRSSRRSPRPHTAGTYKSVPTEARQGFRPLAHRPSLRNVNDLLVGVQPPGSAVASEAIARKLKSQQAESASATSGRRHPLAAPPRIQGAARLNEDQRERARLIMLREDREAAAFAAAAQHFNPEAVNARARRRERELEAQRIAAVRQDLMWAELRRDRTAAQMAQLALKRAELEELQQQEPSPAPQDASGAVPAGEATPSSSEGFEDREVAAPTSVSHTFVTASDHQVLHV